MTAMGDIVEVIAATDGCETLLAAIQAAGLSATLKGGGPLTLFAPVDEAFDLLHPGTVDLLLDDLPRLRALLHIHIVADQIAASAGWPPGPHITLHGQHLRLAATDGTLFVQVARVLRQDLPATNGIVHLIDRVLLPL